MGRLHPAAGLRVRAPTFLVWASSAKAKTHSLSLQQALFSPLLPSPGLLAHPPSLSVYSVLLLLEIIWIVPTSF